MKINQVIAVVVCFVLAWSIYEVARSSFTGSDVSSPRVFISQIILLSVLACLVYLGPKGAGRALKIAGFVAGSLFVGLFLARMLAHSDQTVTNNFLRNLNLLAMAVVLFAPLFGYKGPTISGIKNWLTKKSGPI